MDRDYELEARLLVRWCGWRWMRDRARKLCTLRPPYSGSEWEPSPGYVGGKKGEGEHLELLDIVPAEEERFSDWMTGGAVRYPHGRRNFQHAQFGVPPLSSSLDACGMLKAALIKSGLDIETDIFRPTDLAIPTGELFIHVRISNDDEVSVSTHSVSVDVYTSSDEAMAICQAADAIK